MIAHLRLVAILVLSVAGTLRAGDGPKLEASFPPPESKGGWATLLPESGDPDDSAKARIRKDAGVDWDKLKDAWVWNCKGDGATGLLVIRHGKVVGEWYRGCDKTTAFNIYSSSKTYTSLAYGLTLKDFGGIAPAGRELTLATKVCNETWLPQSLPLPDPRKAEITVKHLLQMASGLTEQNPPEKDHPFEWSFGHVEGSPMAKLKADPGKEFHYSNAGVAHLVVLFKNYAGEDLWPFLKRRILDPIGVETMTWNPIGGDGGSIGPLSQGYSGIMTNPREHARYCTLALHRGVWDGKRLVPESYYDFAWKSSEQQATYGAQWWLYPRFPDAPRDLVQTAGFKANDGFVCPSLDLVVVRLGDGSKLPKDFEKQLIMKVIGAVDAK